MKWRVEEYPVVKRTWGPDDTYETAGYGGPQVFGYKPGDRVYRIVTDFTNDSTDLYEFVDHMNKEQE